MSNSFLDSMMKAAGNKYASIAEDGVEGSDVNCFIDTGSYAFNALLSGSLHGGIAGNKIFALAGEQATGKTWFAMSLVKSFLDANPKAICMYFDSESAITQDMIAVRGIDASRMVIVPVATVEEFRHQVLKVVAAYVEAGASATPMIMVLDSLGMLSTAKEMEDTAKGATTTDMTRAKVIKATFRVLTLELGRVGIPLIMTNHTYDKIGSNYPEKEMGGGSGLKYAASTIVYLSKRKEKVDGEVVGNVIHCKTYKSRFSKENQMVDILLRYDTGLNKYYGLVPIAEKYGVIKKVSTRYELPDGTKVFEKTLNDNPEKYFTDDIMKQLEVAVAKEFKYGNYQNEAVDQDADEESA